MVCGERGSKRMPGEVVPPLAWSASVAYTGLGPRRTPMKVILNETLRRLRNDPAGAKQLREFIATGKLNESRVITIHDKDKDRPTQVRLKIIPAQS